jgi:hypothetical protein
MLSRITFELTLYRLKSSSTNWDWEDDRLYGQTWAQISVSPTTRFIAVG